MVCSSQVTVMNFKHLEIDLPATAEETTGGVFGFSLAAIMGFLCLIVFLA